MTDATLSSSPSTTSTAARRHGAPIWLELNTRDVEQAERFYGELFGWTFADAGRDDARRVLADGAHVADLLPAVDSGDPSDEPSGRARARWIVYLAVDDADEAAVAIAESGGAVPCAPREVDGMGRVALANDAAGDEFGILQPAGFSGFERMREPGTPSWFECMSRDALVSEQFYRSVLGWELTPMISSGQEGEPWFWYATNGEGDDATAGICDASTLLPDGAPGYWRMYVAVQDADAAAARAEELGGKILDGPLDSPIGRIVTIEDPEGSTFQLIQYRAESVEQHKAARD